MANEDKQYLRWLRSRDCCYCGVMAPSIVHHHTARRAMSQRAHDHDGMPMCPRCHLEFHSACGFFKHMKRAERCDWQDRQVQKYRAQYEALLQQEDDESCEDLF